MNWLELFLGQIPEGIFFALFMIFAKEIKDRRTLFVTCATVEYVFLIRCFPYSYVFHLLFLILTFLLLKLFYKERSQITDVFILVLAYFIMCISSVICYYICFSNVVLAALLNKLALFTLLLLLNYKLHAIQKLYKKQWNRGNPDAKIKSTTFRSLNLVLFYVFFVLIHACIIFAVAVNGTGGE